MNAYHDWTLPKEKVENWFLCCILSNEPRTKQCPQGIRTKDRKYTYWVGQEDLRLRKPKIRKFSWSTDHKTESKWTKKSTKTNEIVINVYKQPYQQS